MLFEETDNMIWNESESETAKWCKRNKVYDEITEEEIMEIWRREDPDQESVRVNGKYSRRWQSVCDFINAREDLIAITTFGEHRVVMKR